MRRPWVLWSPHRRPLQTGTADIRVGSLGLHGHGCPLWTPGLRVSSGLSGDSRASGELAGQLSAPGLRLLITPPDCPHTAAPSLPDNSSAGDSHPPASVTSLLRPQSPVPTPMLRGTRAPGERRTSPGLGSLRGRWPGSSADPKVRSRSRSRRESVVWGSEGEGRCAVTEADATQLPAELGSAPALDTVEGGDPDPGVHPAGRQNTPRSYLHRMAGPGWSPSVVRGRPSL